MQKIRWILFAVVFTVFLLPANCLAAAGADDVEITILHTNDMHGRILPEDDGGRSIGLPEIAAAVKAVRQVNPNTLLVDAGDTLHGMPEINISRGENMVTLLNETGYDCMVPGNHDYNYGSKRLEELSRQMKFPLLSANTVDRKTGKLLFPAYKTFQMQGVKIAVFGLTTPETAYKTAPACVQDVQFVDAVQSARDMVRALRKSNDVVIAVTHIGIDKNSVVTTDQIASDVPGIDIIIDGHSHTELPQGLTVGHTLIVQTGCYDHNLGRVDFVVRGHKVVAKTARLYTPEEIKELAPVPDEALAQKFTAIQKRNQPLFDSVVANSDRSFSGDRGVVRLAESALGDLCADAMRVETNADVAFVNGGGIRSGLAAGNVTKRDMMSIFPFGNTVKKIEVSGAVLQAVLEHSVSKYPQPFGGFLQVSGLRFSFQPALMPDHRVSEVLVGGIPLDSRKMYTVTVNDFMYSGGDAYDMLRNARIIGEYGTCEEIFADYLNKNGVPVADFGQRIKRAGLETAVEQEAA